MDNQETGVFKNKNLILINIVLLTFMATLDSSIVNVALPSIATGLCVTTESVAWVVSSYLIGIVSSILIFGKLGDIKGKTNIFKLGILIFTLGSLLCGISFSFVMLIVSRVVQAIGASAAMATNQGIVTQVFPAGERGKALGIVGAFVALGTLVGPPLGGLVLSFSSWHYIFLINIPIGIAVFIMGLKILPKSKPESSEKLDYRGAILFAIATISLFASMIEGRSIGYGNPMIIAGFVIFICSFAIFIVFEKKQRLPLLELSIFKNRLFSLSIICSFFSYVAISCSTLIQPFYLQNTLKLSPATTGLVMMAYPVILAITAPFSGYLSDKIGSEFLTFLGLVFTSAGLFLLSGLTEFSALTTLIIYVGLMALGIGLFQSPNTSLVMSNVPKNMLGVAGSVNALVRNLGLIMGTSLTVAILYSRMSAKIGYHVSSYIENRDDIFIFGMQGAYFTAAAICAVGAVLTAIRLIGRAGAKRRLISGDGQK